MGNVLKRTLVDQSEFLSRFPFTADQLENIRAIGRVLHKGQGVWADKYGEIVVVFGDGKAKENEDARRTEEGTRGSSTGPGERQQGPQASPDSADPVLGQHRSAYREQLSEVEESYPGTNVLDDNFGHWFAVPAFPSGLAGPQIFILVAIPDDLRAPISSWAFWKSENLIAWIGHRHTNYPDGSVCAFPPNGNHWCDGHRLVLYIDRVCEWSIRQIFLWLDGYWPGPQEGFIHRHYRLKEGRANEKCFCGGESYFACCRPRDLMESKATDKTEFMSQCNGLDVGMQRPHPQLFAYLLGKRKSTPNMGQVHSRLVLLTGRQWQNS